METILLGSVNRTRCGRVLQCPTSKSCLLKTSANFVSEVFTILDKRATLTDVSHLRNIDLSHVPSNYLDDYKTLLTNFADVFSRHDLDVGHCKTLPHRVRLTDPNKIDSINQYRLPYQLKEVAIDYVDKLLRSGVVRPSTSVFNSPLMLVKKPNSKPDKPLAE